MSPVPHGKVFICKISREDLKSCDLQAYTTVDKLHREEMTIHPSINMPAEVLNNMIYLAC